MHAPCSTLSAPCSRTRLAFIISHPIQYYVPLYRRLAKRGDLEIKVFYTWHVGDGRTIDQGFLKQIAWDIPLTEGYTFEAVPNKAWRPGTHHFGGLHNPSLVERVLAWKPDAVHLTGYTWLSHLLALRAFRRRGVPVLFRGDSHLLNERQSGWKWFLKRSLLHAVFAWPRAFLYVGQANKRYYEQFHVPGSKLFHCPHSVDVDRFSEPNDHLEQQAAGWRNELGLVKATKVLLFAGKFENKKRPVPLMNAMLGCSGKNVVLVLVGDGACCAQVRQLAAAHPQHFRVLPFQNQTRMPLVYRLGDIFVLPSAYGETWGLAVNEALACGRPVLVSDKVGCAADLVRPDENGSIFHADDWRDFHHHLGQMLDQEWRNRRPAIRAEAARFSPEATEKSLVSALRDCLKSREGVAQAPCLSRRAPRPTE